MIIDNEPMDPVGKKFSDKELAEVIKKALANEGRSGSHPVEEGVTLEELVAIGKDLGISIEAIRSAAYAVASETHDRINPFLGESVSVSADRTIPTETSQQQLQKLSKGLSTLMGEDGVPSAAEGIVGWRTHPTTAMRTGREIQVEVRSFGGNTHVSARQTLTGIAVGLFAGLCCGGGIGIGVGIGVGVGVGALGSALFATLFPIGVLGLSYWGARFAYKKIVANARLKVEALSTKVHDYLIRGSGTGKPQNNS